MKLGVGDAPAAKDQPCQVWSTWDQWPRSGVGVKYTGGVIFFFFLSFYSLTGPQTKQKVLEVHKMARKTRIRVRECLCGCFTPKPQKLGVSIGFPMQMKMMNISKTVLDSAIVCMGSK